MLERVPEEGAISRFALPERPRLRPVDAFPTRHRGQPGLILRDTSDRDLPPMFVSSEAVRVLELLDGRRTIADIVRALSLRGSTMTDRQVRDLLTQIDQAGY